jgi:ribosomal protein L11
VFAGAVAAVGLWMLLYAFGLAIGASTLNVQDADSAKATGIFTGVWGAVAPLIALFIGGIVAGRGAGVDRRGDGALHGFVTWALAAILGAYMVANLVGAVAGGVASVGKSAAKAAGGAGASAPQIEQALRSAGLDANDLVRPINERLRAAGQPTVSPQEMAAVGRDVLQRSVRTGGVDQQVIIQSVTDNTSLSRADAQQVAGQLQSQLQTARGQLMNEVQSAADTAGKALWGAFIALALGLIAAIVGGIVGVPGLRRRPFRREPAPAPVSAPRGPVRPPREVYP